MHSRHLALAAVSLAALAAAEPARAQCTTVTAAGVTTLSCGDTETIDAVNENQNNPSTTAYWQRFPTTIEAAVPSGITIAGRGLLIEGTGSNPIDVAIAASASITGQTTGLAMLSNGGELRLTTGFNSTISATGPAGVGLQLRPGDGPGTIVADLRGAITSAGTGLLLEPGDGAVNVTIGGSLSGNNLGLHVNRQPGRTGLVDILVLGTISSPGTAVDFDGTLRVGNGGRSGAIEGNIVNRGNLIFDRFDSTYDGVISGTGTLTKRGMYGYLALTGVNTFTGTTNVEAGTLYVNGSLAGPVTVARGGRLSGFGSVGDATVSGSLAPAGTFTVNGNLVLNAGSSFDLGIGQGVSALLRVTGTASLTGMLRAAPSGNSHYTPGRYLVLTASGGISGRFESFDGRYSLGPFFDGAFVSLSAHYDANNVYLNVGQLRDADQTTLAFLAPRLVVDQRFVFSTRLLVRPEGGMPLYDQIFALAFQDPAVQAEMTAARATATAAGGPGVIAGDPVRTNRTVTSVTVQGTPIFAVADNSVTTTSGTTYAIFTHVIVYTPLTGCRGAALALPSTTRPVCTPTRGEIILNPGDASLQTFFRGEYLISETRTDIVTDNVSETWELNGPVTAVGTIHAAVQSGLFDLGDRLLGRLTAIEAGNAGWGEAYRFRVSQNGRRDARGLAGGVGIGVAPGVTLALGVDQGWLDIDVPGALETGEVELTELGAALRFDSGPFSASLAAVHGFGEAETLRTIIGASAADYDVRLTGAALEIGYSIEAGGGWTLRPVAGLDYVHISTDGFTETDMLGLVAQDRSVDRVRASAGLEIGRDFGPVALVASARYLAVLDGEERTLPAAFAMAPGAPLTIAGPSEPDAAMVGARMRVPVVANVAFTLGYDGRFGGDYESHAGFAGLSLTW